MINRRFVLYVVALATVATVALGLLGRTELAIAALAVATMSSFGWIVLWARALNARLAQIGGEIERQGARNLKQVEEFMTAIESLDAGLSSTRQYVARRADAHDDKLGRLRREVYSVNVSVQRTPSATTELGRVYRRLVRHDHPMPELGGWAMTSATLVWVVDQIASGHVSTILECGSGSSTVWFALALEQRGTAGRIMSLESSAEYADQTRARLAELGTGSPCTSADRAIDRSRPSGTSDAAMVRPVCAARRHHRRRLALRRRSGRRHIASGSLSGPPRTG